MNDALVAVWSTRSRTSSAHIILVMEGLGSMGMRARRGAHGHPAIDQLAPGTRSEQPSSRSRQRPLISWPWAR
eukprot:13128815-Heterocapsa_arctica.AAC.1